MNLRQFFERYGVALGVVAILALVIAVLPGNTNGLTKVGTSGSGKSGTAAGASGTSGAGGRPSAPAPPGAR